MHIDYSIENLCSFCRQKFPKAVKFCPNCHQQLRSTNCRNRGYQRTGGAI